MRKFRVCIGSNDDENMADTHMGDTRRFHIYDLFENSESVFVDKRGNVAREMDHAKADKMKAIIESVGDADVLVARKMSPNFSRIASGTRHQPVVVAALKIQDVLLALGRAFDEIHGYVERRRNGECFDTVPELPE